MALLLVTAVYAPSLSGGWVWDDHSQLEANPTLATPSALWLTDIRHGGATEATDIYRPLVMSSYVPGQSLAPGPTSARLGNLAVHLGVVVLVARLALQLGAAGPWAWLAAATFGVHPGATEAVAWITGRHDALPALLMLGAFVLLPRRPVLAGALCALTPLAKEPYLLAPVALALWGWGRRQWSWPAIGVAAIGPVLALALRSAAGVAFPVAAAATDPLGGLGAFAVRGVTLALDPTAPDAAALYVSQVGVGWAVVVLSGAVLITAARTHRLRGLALVAAPTLLLLPCVPASARNGLIGDRYFYLFLATLAVGLAVAVTRGLGDRRWAYALGLVPLVLAPFSARRASEWASDTTLWAASYARDPGNTHAAFHLGYALHTEQGDCAGAVPLYGKAVAIEGRARTNLMACLVKLGRNEEAVARAPELAAYDPTNPKVPATAARALVALGRLDEARAWAERAVAAAGRPEDWLLVGNIAGSQGDLDAAGRAFRAVLAASPGHPGAEAGLRAVLERSAGVGR